MNWIEKIRSKPREYKVRLMWIILVSVAVLLLIVWIFTSKIGKNFNSASWFIKDNVKQIKQEGSQLYNENK